MLRQRRSMKVYDPNRAVTEEQLAELFELTTLAPSAWNFQHYKFIVVRDPEQKQRLRQAAMGQEKVEQAACTIVVCGDLAAWKRAEDVAREFARKGFYGESTEEKIAKQAEMMRNAYKNNPTKAREEAIRSASLAAMSLMVAAEDMGLATCPMIGFDPNAVAEVTELDDTLFPAMLITLGYAGDFDLPRCDRLPLSEVVNIDRLGVPFGANQT
ncbi:Nitroreductase [Marininema mesophilum]|uniref:Nitroreductase n=1 Tax=Marininema mesophilum TaxID=1048340 RepID=A0A1H2YNN2_9BACL|nr:Nitroreductase [Marininema mesophilum]